MYLLSQLYATNIFHFILVLTNAMVRQLPPLSNILAVKELQVKKLGRSLYQITLESYNCTDNLLLFQTLPNKVWEYVKNYYVVKLFTDMARCRKLILFRYICKFLKNLNLHKTCI